ncbi:hypothetical protein ALQ08_103762 [Pseudomonas syringae pv. delphinii]|uniref:Uncharacterized protein n=1 Tax=Pseudomonas syringae pv. delphinii TaxID=192088 RepID=A0A3M4JTU9_9PSED|nr:hypothetical protein ALQ08_103762 [Pseudomonas syringae pv. delphinii]
MPSSMQIKLSGPWQIWHSKNSQPTLINRQVCCPRGLMLLRVDGVVRVGMMHRMPWIAKKTSLSSDSELSKISEKANIERPSSESELSLKSASYGTVRIPNSYSTYTNTNTSVCKSSVPREAVSAPVDLPPGFERFTEDQRFRAMTALQSVEPTLREPLLDQWRHRCNSGSVKNPFGYLLSCMQKALSGEFNAQWQAPRASAHNPQAHSPQPKHLSNAPDQPKPTPPPPVKKVSPQDRDESSLAAGRSSMMDIKRIIRPRSQC